MAMGRWEAGPGVVLVVATLGGAGAGDAVPRAAAPAARRVPAAAAAARASPRQPTGAILSRAPGTRMATVISDARRAGREQGAGRVALPLGGWEMCDGGGSELSACFCPVPLAVRRNPAIAPDLGLEGCSP